MMTESEMKQLLQQDGKKVEAALQELLPDDAISALQRTSVVEAMRYSLEAGGKRIRPVLVLEFCKMFGGTEEQAMPAAAAIEMIHTFSMICRQWMTMICGVADHLVTRRSQKLLRF